MARAKRRDLTTAKAAKRFSAKMSNLSKQVEYYNSKNKDTILEIKVIPSLDNTMYPKLILAKRKK